MQLRSIARELALLALSQFPEKDLKSIESSNIDILLNKALEGLMENWREDLESCANELEKADQFLLDSELQESEKLSTLKVREHLKKSLSKAESVLNTLSSSLDLPRLLALSDQKEVRTIAIQQIKLVLQKRPNIDDRLDSVMEGWRLKRLPRIDRDILRLAVVDLIDFQTPAPVTFNEAVNLANRYSDEQGRRMINGVLRRLQDSYNNGVE